jgi:hypothetical protein
MNTKTRKWTVGSLLTLALCGMTVSVGRGDDDDEALKKAIAAAKKVIMEKAGTKIDAAALAKEHKMEATMKLFKPKSKGGIGIGGLTGANHKDSIELLIRDYSIKPPTKAEVGKYADDLIKAAQITGTIGELTPYWGPAKPGPMGKTPEKWKSLSEEMQKASAELIKAAKAKDEVAVAESAKRLNNSCAECHKVFRDDK